MKTARAATLADAGAIAAVGVRAWQQAYRGLMPAEFLAGLDVRRGSETWSATIANDLNDVLVVDAEPGVAGFCWLKPGEHPAGELVALYVDPDQWGRGLGTSLVAAAMQRAAQRGFAAVQLWALEQNERARRFYVARGFSETAARRTHERWGFALTECRYDMGVANWAPERVG
jgi:ribosomal protein S18 acetylase RimI-like enzyme